jgi:hypothetical protein
MCLGSGSRPLHPRVRAGPPPCLEVRPRGAAPAHGHVSAPGRGVSRTHRPRSSPGGEGWCRRLAVGARRAGGPERSDPLTVGAPPGSCRAKRAMPWNGGAPSGGSGGRGRSAVKGGAGLAGWLCAAQESLFFRDQRCAFGAPRQRSATSRRAPAPTALPRCSWLEHEGRAIHRQTAPAGPIMGLRAGVPITGPPGPGLPQRHRRRPQANRPWRDPAEHRR